MINSPELLNKGNTCPTEQDTQAELLGQSSNYPAELFDGLPDDETKERVVRIAKFLVMKRLGLPCEHETLIKIASGEKSGSFMSAILKTRSGTYGNYKGLCEGDIEVEAKLLGVDEIIWPFDEREMVKAAKEERQLAQTNGSCQEAPTEFSPTA